MFDKEKQDYYTVVKIKGNNSFGMFGMFGKTMFDSISQELKSLFEESKIVRLYDKAEINANNVVVDGRGMLRMVKA